MRFLPWPRSTSTKVVSSDAFNWGVKVPRTSCSVAKAVTIRETGDVTFLAAPPEPDSPCGSVHWVRIDNESLPTGMDMPKAGHSSMPTALTVAYSAASSPCSPQAAIQLADSLTRGSSMGAASRFVMASATAMRPDAGASSAASGVRSPMDMASPAKPLKSASVTAQSATGTCQGPTIWSRCVRPPTVRSPIVMRKRLEATVGCASTSITAFCRSTPVRSSGLKVRATVLTSRCIFGGLPRSTFIGILTGASWSSSTNCNWRSSVATPITANGQRSRSHRALNCSSESGAMAST